MLEHTLQEEIKPAPAAALEMGDQLIRQLREKLYTLQSMSIMSLATLLDPRFKVIGFFSQTKATEAIKRLTSECATIIRSKQSAEEIPQASTSHDVTGGSKLWHLLDTSVMEARKTQNDMNNAVITPCSHFFHAGCLKKWLYVQETCPLCHSQLKSQSPTTNQDAPAANQSPAGQEEVAVADKKPKDGALPDGAKREGTAEQEGGNGPATSAGESSSSGGPSSPQHLAQTPSSSSSSSSSSPSPLVTESQKQSLTDQPSLSSTSSSAATDMLPSPPSPSHSSPLQPVVQADMTLARPEPAPQLSRGFLFDSEESPAGPSWQLEQPTSPPPCSL
ncbi:hypothetical protein VZT92_021290 [Zoarces viviparus]|uniref:cullin-RING-type E3 NEDD8 transferase n=1 Tax=Zoarces viviparus TaxID=48416 RepID=A0AAW1EG06_ZOAVI